MFATHVALLPLLLFASAAFPQQPVAPPPAPSDSGPSLADTMKYIQDKFHAIGEMRHVLIFESGSASDEFKYTEVVADASQCTLESNFITTINSSDGSTTTILSTLLLPLGKVVSIEVKRESNPENGAFTFSPFFTELTVKTTDAAIHYHQEITSLGAPPAKVDKKHPAPTPSTTIVEKEVKASSYLFDEEDAADRTAKALLHAIELCGGGKKELF